jgi:hypothetical protein
MKHNAFFITPQGKIVPVPALHITAIVNNPPLFGLTTAAIEKLFAKYNETIGTEGKARNEIILTMLKQNWVRLRFEPAIAAWRLQIFEKLNAQLKKNIQSFLTELQQGNITNNSYKLANPDIEIYNTLHKTIISTQLSKFSFVGRTP